MQADDKLLFIRLLKLFFYCTASTKVQTLESWSNGYRLPIQTSHDLFQILQTEKMSKIVSMMKRRHILEGLFRHGRRYCTGGSRDSRYLRVLGIESSCDDTGAAVVDSNGVILGEALNSQTALHVDMGGVMPYVAQDLHAANIDSVVTEALRNAQMDVSEVDAIACTNRPGLVMSLRVGLNYAKKLVERTKKPFIPVHHMRAHALTVRMMEKVEFPFLVYLLSGGHCLLAVAKGVDDFLILGSTLDVAPGDAFDKTARELKLKNVPECYGLGGGASLELMARSGDPTAFEPVHVLTQEADCNFSFCGLTAQFKRRIKKEEEKHGVVASAVLPNASDICASFQYSLLKHLAKRLQRALLYCEQMDLLPADRKTLVISGGVGSNQYLREGLTKVCDHFDCKLICPLPKLCTDNGIMIAWTGVENLRIDSGIAPDPDAVDVERKSDIGQDISHLVTQCNIKAHNIKLL